MEDLPVAEHEDDTVQEQFGGSRKIVDHESDYSKRRFNRTLSPTRADPTGKGGDARDVSTYADRMREAQLDRERDNTMRQIAQKQREEAEKAAADARLAAKEAKDAAVRRLVTGEALRRANASAATGGTLWRRTRGETPKMEEARPAGVGGSTHGGGGSGGLGRVWIGRRNRWDATPADVGALSGATPRRARSRWDATPRTWARSRARLR